MYCLNLLPAAAKYNAAAPAQQKKASIKHAPVDQHLYADGKAALLDGSCTAFEACKCLLFAKHIWVCEHSHLYRVFADYTSIYWC